MTKMGENTIPGQGQVAVVDNSFAPDVFADDVMSFGVLDGTVRITFLKVRLTEPPPGQFQRIIIGRLIMPIPAAQRFAVGLYDFLKQRDLDPSVAVPTEGGVQ